MDWNYAFALAQLKQQHCQSSQEESTMKSKSNSYNPTKEATKVKRCQADGCMADLSGLRPYLRRYHVCEEHIRSQTVVIKSRQVRFCDQCSTFHPISHFDGCRRTCRQKLAHNRQKRRARRSQSAGNKLDAKQGTMAGYALASGGSLCADDCNVTARLATSEVCSTASVYAEDTQDARLRLVDRAPAPVASSGPWRSGTCPQPEQRWEAASSVYAEETQDTRLRLVDRAPAPVASSGPWRSGTCPPPEQRCEAATSVYAGDTQGMRLRLVDRAPAPVASSGPWRSGTCPPPEQRCEAATSVYAGDTQGMRLRLVDRAPAPVASSGPWRSGTCPQPEQRWEAATSVYAEETQDTRLRLVDRAPAPVASSGPWRSGTCPQPEQRWEAASSVYAEETQDTRLRLVDRAPAPVASSGRWRSGAHHPVNGVCSSRECIDCVQSLRLHLLNVLSTPATPGVRWPNGFSHVEVL
ncbi:hypothetical protein Vretimale_12260 [Volvox reticuliferus]|uniref:SBP-type domain-containing protein n=1 Tax=Volvox reticuliferus TaxID=1737510 RepID=A0A8J4GI85_9CHLO|nr:hypothetical protein Vretimale_12260 [Volvox reticuliferus]